MKHSLFLTMMAAALLGGQVFAESRIFKVSDYENQGEMVLDAEESKVVVDTQKTLLGVSGFYPDILTLDYQGDFVLTASEYLDTPDRGVLNITTTVPAVATTWEDAFSVEGGGSITLCAGSIDSTFGPVQFFGTAVDSTVQLGNSDVKFIGKVDALSDLAMNQVGVVLGETEITLVGKIGTEPSPVPEPTTGSLSLLALAGLCARRRRRK